MSCDHSRHGTQQNYEVPLTLEVAAEPQLAWHGIVDVTIDRAVDDRGQELFQTLASKDSSGSDVWDDDIRWLRARGFRKAISEAAEPGQTQQASIRLTLAREPARYVRALHGTLIGQMDTPPETLIDVPDVLRAGGQTLTGKDRSVLKLGEIKRDDRGVVQVPVELQTGLSDDLVALSFPVSNRRLMNQAILWQLRAEIRGGGNAPQFELRDPKGQTFDLARYNETAQFNGHASQYAATLHFLPRDGVGEPARLVLIGRRTVVVEVPFTLYDIPLP